MCDLSSLSNKPYAQWTAENIGELCGGELEKPGFRRTLLKIALNPSFETAFRMWLRSKGKERETVVYSHAKSISAEEDPDRYLIHKAGVFLLRQAAWLRAAKLFWKLGSRKGSPSPITLASELMMVRLIVGVPIGMLAICGSSPWPLLDSLNERGAMVLAVVCFIVAFA